MSYGSDLPYDGRRKLTSEQVVEMRSLAGALTQAELAERFGVSQAQVSLILRGKSRPVQEVTLQQRYDTLLGLAIEYLIQIDGEWGMGEMTDEQAQQEILDNINTRIIKARISGQDA